MERRRFTREFKVGAVKLVRERGVAVVQAARDLNVHENVLRKWVKEFHVFDLFDRTGVIGRVERCWKIIILRLALVRDRKELEARLLAAAHESLHRA